MLPDLHTNFSRGRSGGLVFPSLSEFSTVYCDPHSQRHWHSQYSGNHIQSFSSGLVVIVCFYYCSLFNFCAIICVCVHWGFCYPCGWLIIYKYMESIVFKVFPKELYVPFEAQLQYSVWHLSTPIYPSSLDRSLVLAQVWSLEHFKSFLNMYTVLIMHTTLWLVLVLCIFEAS